MYRQKAPTPIRFTPEQVERLTRAARETGIPKNRIVRMALDAYFRESA